MVVMALGEWFLHNKVEYHSGVSQNEIIQDLKILDIIRTARPFSRVQNNSSIIITSCPKYIECFKNLFYLILTPSDTLLFNIVHPLDFLLVQ